VSLKEEAVVVRDLLVVAVEVEVPMEAVVAAAAAAESVLNAVKMVTGPENAPNQVGAVVAVAMEIVAVGAEVTGVIEEVVVIAAVEVVVTGIGILIDMEVQIDTEALTVMLVVGVDLVEEIGTEPVLRHTTDPKMALLEKNATKINCWIYLAWPFPLLCVYLILPVW
jgi:hypothetical protein